MSPPTLITKISSAMSILRLCVIYLYNKYYTSWLAKNVDKFYSASGSPKPKKLSVKVSFDELYDKFLSERKLGEGRKRHYEVLRRMINRYES